MTTAVCFKCGSLKFGSFCPCPECHERPRTEDDLIISLAMSDHYFDLSTLEQMGEAVRTHGQPPDLDPDSKEAFRKLIAESRASGALDEIFAQSDD